MLKALKFVQGAVSKKDYQPALKHFRIKNGRITGYNGIVALSSPIDLDIEATPHAGKLVKAIERCEVETALNLTAGGKLHIRSGQFRAYVDCHEESEILDGIVPTGQSIPTVHNMLESFRSLAPFIATDASRPWANGILLRGYSAFATNNIIVAEYWLGHEVPDINLPVSAINELLRIKEEPIDIWLDENTATFFFEGDRWMRTQLLGPEWPDVSQMLNSDMELYPFPENFFDTVEKLVPFVEEDGRVFFRAGRITTSPEEGAGASVEFDGLPDFGAYHYKHLMSLRDVVTEINFTTHPKPCPFRGSNLRGIFLGMVDA